MRFSEGRLGRRGFILRAAVASGLASAGLAGCSRGEDGAVEALVPSFADRIASSFAAASRAWPGFNPDELPFVLFGNTEKPPTLLSSDVDVARALGAGASRPASSGRELWAIEGPHDDVLASLTGVVPFSLEVSLKGRSFALFRYGEGAFVDGSPNSVLRIVHELFHVYQARAFEKRGSGGEHAATQLDAEQLELILREEELLEGLLSAEPADLKNSPLLRKFVTIRLARRALHRRTEWEERQERLEGSARWLEHRIGESDSLYHPNNFDVELIAGTEEFKRGVVGHLTFGRCYASGSAVTEIATRIDPDALQRISSGRLPADLLIECTDLSENDALGQFDRVLRDGQASIRRSRARYLADRIRQES